MGFSHKVRRVAPVVGIVVLALATVASAQAPFGDVPDDAYYSDAVQWMVDEGLTTGDVDGRFRPEDPVTRGETAVFLWRLAGQPKARVHTFTDVTVGWQDDAIAWMAQEAITQGSTPTTFDPDGLVSRGALSVFLHRLAGEPSAPNHSFVDVDAQTLQAPVSWVAAEEISSGIAPGEFGPDVPVVRGQLAVFLQRFDATGVLDGIEPDEPGPPVTAVSDPDSTAPSAVLSVSPTSPRVSERITIAGGGFGPGSVLLTIGDEVAAVTETNANGAFEVTVVVPAIEAGIQPVTAVSAGTVVASSRIDVRPEAPSSYLLPIAFLVAALSAVAWWSWSRRRGGVESETVADAEEPPHEVARPEPERVERRSSDVFSITPVDAGAIDGLAELNGVLWGSARVEFDGIDHAMVLTTPDRGQEWLTAADLGPGYIDAVAVSDRDAVALGSRFVPTELGMARRPTMWHSNDLRSWMAIGLPPGDSFEEASFDGVLGLDGSMVAYGRNAHGPCLWTGSDEGWVSQRMMGPIDVVAATRQGVLLFGRNSEQRSGIALVSNTGTDWAVNDHPSTELLSSATVLAVTDFEGGLVAAGYDNLRGTAAVWVSDDGLQWHRSPMEFDEDTGVEHLVVVDGVLVAVGSIRTTSAGARRSRIGVWTSIDAVDWTVADDGGLGVDGRVHAVIADGSNVVIAGSMSTDTEAPVVWRYFGAGLRATPV